MVMRCLVILLALHLTHGAAGLQFLALGDWGDTSLDRQSQVAAAMDSFCATEQCDFIVSTGDNFYMDGVVSVDDPKWNTSWRDVYDGENVRELTWYVSVGNHDHTPLTNNELYQVEFSALEPRWQLPWLWHDKLFTVGDDINVHMVFIDTESMWQRKHNVTEQEIWLEETLCTSTADFLLVTAHHPSYSSGDYFGNVVTRDYLDPLFRDCAVDVFLTGHDHNLQHIVPINASEPFPTEHIVSGGGGRRPYSYSSFNQNLINRAGYTNVYFGEYNGFTAVEVLESVLRIRHYTYEAEEGAEVAPVLVYEVTRPRVRAMKGK